MSPVSDDWKVQYRRILNCKKYLTEFKILLSDDDFDYFYDHTHFFFQSCYHLKDWLINCGYNKKDVENYVSKNRHLEICGGVANATKHYTFNDRTKIRFNNKPVRTFFKTPLGYDVGTSTGCATHTEDSLDTLFGSKNPLIINGDSITLDTGGYVITYDDSECFELFDFIDKCIEEWNEYPCIKDLLKY